MALTLTNLERMGGTSCRHYRFTVNDNGTTRSAVVHVDEIEQEVRTTENYKFALTLLWVYYKIKVNGATPASLVGETIMP